MPLSEHEQRILAQLEESLVKEDPQFAERVRSSTMSPQALTQCKWSALTFAAGLALLVAFYSQSVTAGLVGVGIMFVSAVVFERNVRRLGASGWRDARRARKPQDPPRTEHPVRGPRDWVRSRLFRRRS